MLSAALQLISQPWPLLALTALTYLVLVASRHLHYRFTHFPRMGVTGHPPWPIYGSMSTIRGVPYSQLLAQHYARFKSHFLYGYFELNKPFLVITEPDLIKQITVKAFDHFTDRRQLIPVPDEEPLLGKSLFLLRGDRWRDMRTTLSPAFTGSKVRHMFHLVTECSHRLSGVLLLEAAKAADTGTPLLVEMKDLTRRYAIDVIASTAFGLQVDSLRDRNNEFYTMARDSLQYHSSANLAKFAMIQGSPGLARWLSVKLFTGQQVRFFGALVHDTMRHREVNEIFRPDMIQLLLEARNGFQRYEEAAKAAGEGTAAAGEAASVDCEGYACQTEEVGSEDLRGYQKRFWSEEDVTAQCYLFVYAGYETTSTLLSFVAYELMANWQVQSRLIAELDEAKSQLNGQPLTYEALVRLKYLDMVVSETMRKWPPNMFTDRQCTKDYQLKDGQGRVVTVRKGEGICIPIYAIHRDAEYYPDPERFDPERFSEERKHTIKPFTFLALGAGPRNCIGSRFVLMEVKAFLFHLLTTFTLEVGSSSQIPIQLRPAGWLYRTTNGVNVQLRRR